MRTTIIGQFSVDNDDNENCSHSTPSVTHDSPSSYISATKIPLPQDTMEDNSDCLSAMERELGLQHQSLNDIHDQLIMLIVSSRGGPYNPHLLTTLTTMSRCLWGGGSPMLQDAPMPVSLLLCHWTQGESLLLPGLPCLLEPLRASTCRVDPTPA